MSKLRPELSIDPEKAAELMLKASSRSDLAMLLEVPVGQLLYILYEQPDSRKYESFSIPKRNGELRYISSPRGSIRILQYKLKPIFDQIYKVQNPAHGFVIGKSVYTNANEHQGKRWVFNIDLASFFPSINFGRIRGLFMSRPFQLEPDAATILAQLCCLDGALPQGAPTSPVLSNMISFQLDRELRRLARKTRSTYTRYADDITFSTSQREFPEELAHYRGHPILDGCQIGKVLEQVISDCGFEVNYDKVRLQFRGIRQEVTGLTVNDFPNVRRKYVRNIRAMIHHWRSEGVVEAEFKHLTKVKRLEVDKNDLDGSRFKSIVFGKLAYLRMIRGSKDSVLSKLCKAIVDFDSDVPDWIKEMSRNYEMFDVFICHASEDKDTIAKPIYDACIGSDIKAFLDEKYIGWGDSLTEKINHALGQSTYVLAIISTHSLDKSWPGRELNAAIAREISGKQIVLPLIVGEPNMGELGLIEDKLHLNWNDNPQEIVDELGKMLNSEGDLT